MSTLKPSPPKDQTKDQSQIEVAGLRVQIERKAIKNLHIGVYPPDGRVRVATPPFLDDDAVRLAVIGKLTWIKQKRREFEAQPRQSEREMCGGESHYLWGQRRRLRVHDTGGPARFEMNSPRFLDAYFRPELSAPARERALQEWQRAQLREKAIPLLEKWAETLEVPLPTLTIRRMKTRWGSCHMAAQRVILNLELAKKPLSCLEYVVVHELIHLRVRAHNAAFIALLTRHLPDWSARRDALNAAPLAHEDWSS